MRYNYKKQLEFLQEKYKSLENQINGLEYTLYKFLDNQKIKEMSKKYKVEINFKYIFWEYELYLNNKRAQADIRDKHKYIQSSEFERDIKAFLYNRKKEDK